MLVKAMPLRVNTSNFGKFPIASRSFDENDVLKLWGIVKSKTCSVEGHARVSSVHLNLL